MSDEATAVSYDHVFDAFPGVPITRDNVGVYEQRLHRRLCVMRCSACNLLHNPPRSFCPHCLSREVDLVEVSGRGQVALFTRLHAGVPAEGIDYGIGHPLAVVSLEEQPGLRLAGQFVTTDRRDAKIGETVELTWITRHRHPVPAFTPSADRTDHGSDDR